MPDSPDILLKYILTGKIWQQTTQTTLWLRSKPTADTSDMQDYCDAILNDFEVFWLPSLLNWSTSDWELVQAQVLVLTGANPYQSIKSYTNKTGNEPPDALPPHDAGLLSMYTEFHGRRVHGRLYLPGIPELQTAGGRISDAQLAKLDTIGQLLVSRYGLNSNNAYVNVCVFSRKNGVERRAGPPPQLVYSPLAALPITRTVANRNVATQRHRKIGRGI